jgi:hypothetical protein
MSEATLTQANRKPANRRKGRGRGYGDQPGAARRGAGKPVMRQSAATADALMLRQACMLWQACLHESSHCVIAWIYREPIARVEYLGESGAVTWTNWAPDGVLETRRWHARVKIAGICAQYLYGPDDGCSSDKLGLDSLLETDAELRSVWSWSEDSQIVHQLLRRHRAQVEGLALVLLQVGGNLSGPQVEALLGPPPDLSRGL